MTAPPKSVVVVHLRRVVRWGRVGWRRRAVGVGTPSPAQDHRRHPPRQHTCAHRRQHRVTARQRRNHRRTINPARDHRQYRPRQQRKRTAGMPPGHPLETGPPPHHQPGARSPPTLPPQHTYAHRPSAARHPPETEPPPHRQSAHEITAKTHPASTHTPTNRAPYGRPPKTEPPAHHQPGNTRPPPTPTPPAHIHPPTERRTATHRRRNHRRTTNPATHDHRQDPPNGTPYAKRLDAAWLSMRDGATAAPSTRYTRRPPTPTRRHTCGRRRRAV